MNLPARGSASKALLTRPRAISEALCLISEGFEEYSAAHSAGFSLRAEYRRLYVPRFKTRAPPLLHTRHHKTPSCVTNISPEDASRSLKPHPPHTPMSGRNPVSLKTQSSQYVKTEAVSTPPASASM